MLTIRQNLLSFWRDESGTETVEWAILAALLLIVAAGVWTTLGNAVVTKITELATKIGG